MASSELLQNPVALIFVCMYALLCAFMRGVHVLGHILFYTHGWALMPSVGMSISIERGRKREVRVQEYECVALGFEREREGRANDLEEAYPSIEGLPSNRKYTASIGECQTEFITLSC